MTALAAWALLCVAGLPTLVLAIELLAAHLPRRRMAATAGAAGAAAGSLGLVILIPAHDEASGIAAAIGHARQTSGRLLVIADNCADDTARLAREAGAEVIERRDPDRRGKGFALGFARGHLAADPPDIVVVIDADCIVEGDGVVRLAAAAHAAGRPVQSAYLMRARPDRGALVGLSGFAFLLRNLVRQRGLARLGAPALLTGSGMAFPWPAFAAAPLDSGDLVEDLGIGIALARAGLPPVFLPDAVTRSDPARRSATLGQRARWEQGFLRTAWRAAPQLIATGRWPLLWLGLHLTVPPLALLGLIDLAALILLAASPVPFAILTGLLGLLALLLALAWGRFGRDQIGLAQLLLIPLYMLWKLPLYGAALFRPERRWARTDRD